MLFSSYFSSQTTRCKIQLDSDVKAIDDKIKWQGSVSARHVILHFLPLVGHNFWLVYYRFKCKGNLCKYGLCYTWVQILLQIGPLLRLGSKCCYGKDNYYAWVQMLLQMGHLLHLGPVITLSVPSTTCLRGVGGVVEVFKKMLTASPLLPSSLFSLARFFAACALFSLLVRPFYLSTLTESLAEARTKSANAQIRVVNEFPRSQLQKLLLMMSLSIQK